MEVKKINYICLLASFLLFFGLIVYAQQTKVIFLTLTYFFGNGTIKPDGITVNYGNEFLPPMVEGKPTFKLVVHDIQKNEIYLKYFSITYVILDRPMPENFSFEISVPYYKDGKFIKIYDLYGAEVSSVDLSIICNKNNICDNSENYFSCADDCPSGSNDGTCDKVKDGRCDPDCPIPSVDSDCLQLTTTTIGKVTTTTIPAEEPTKPVYIYLIIIGTIIAVVAVLLYKIKVVR